MARKEPNIDLIFRNGLKDFESLPPSDVWENIQPSISTSARSFSFLKVAASVAVVLSLGVVASRMSSSLSEELSEEISSFDIEQSPSLNEPMAPVIALNEYVRENRSSLKATPTLERAEDESVTVNSSIDEVVAPLNESALPASLERETEREEGSNLFLDEGASSPLFDIYQRAAVSTDEKTNKWSVSAKASPIINISKSAKNSVSMRNSSEEQSVVSFSGGLGFSFKVNKRVSIQSGVYYLAMGQRVEGVTTYDGFVAYNRTKGGVFDVRTTNGIIQTNSPDIFIVDNVSNRLISAYSVDNFDPEKVEMTKTGNSLTQNFSYVELPFYVRYQVIDKDLDVNVVGGISSNVLVGNSVQANIDGSQQVVGKTEGLNNLLFSSSIGLGVEYSFSNSLSFNIEPTFRYFLTPFNGTTGFTSHNYTFGLFSGLSYKF